MSIRIDISDDIALCRDLRRIVFIDEQGVSVADEIDDLDEVSTHLVAWSGDNAIGSARITCAGDTAKIGRVCVLKHYRGEGVGVALIEIAKEVAKTKGATTVKLGAQTHALGFYQALGFVAEGPEFDDAGIPHRDMVWHV